MAYDLSFEAIRQDVVDVVCDQVFRDRFDTKALLGPQSLEDAIVTVDEQRTQRENFGRKVVLDLSTREKEIDAFHFPCSQILNSDDWE